MPSKIISHRKLCDTLALTEDNRGFWLWDDTRKMNLAMYEKTPEAAFVAALKYYQDRLKKVEAEHKTLKDRVDAFIEPFISDSEGQDNDKQR